MLTWLLILIVGNRNVSPYWIKLHVHEYECDTVKNKFTEHFLTCGFILFFCSWLRNRRWRKTLYDQSINCFKQKKKKRTASICILLSFTNQTCLSVVCELQSKEEFINILSIPIHNLQDIFWNIHSESCKYIHNSIVYPTNKLSWIFFTR